MKRSNNLFWGLIFIIIGLALLGSRIFNYDINLFKWRYWWPLFVLLPGLSFEFGYFTSRSNAGVLVPGGILTVIGSLFFFETFTGWRFSGYTWPVYLLAVAFGLFQLYLFSKEKNTGLLVPVFILTIIPAIAFSGMFIDGLSNIISSNVIFGAVFIVLGLSIFYKSFKK